MNCFVQFVEQNRLVNWILINKDEHKMGLSRKRVSTARIVQSRRRVWLRLSDNEQKNGQNVCGQEILLEPKNSTYNEKTKEKKEAFG